MSDPVTTPTYRPIGEESSGAGRLFRHVVPPALFAWLVIAWVRPDWLPRILPGSLADPKVSRVLSVAALIGFALATTVRDALRFLDARRRAVGAFASRVGGRVVERPARVGPSGWDEASQVEYDAQGLTAALAICHGEKATFTSRIAATVRLKRDLQLQIVPGGAAMRFVLSKHFALPLLSIAVRASGTASVKAIRAAATGSPPPPPGTPELTPEHFLERMGFLGDDPITVGDPEFDRRFLVKASDRDLGRAVASDSGLRAAITALAALAPNFQVGVSSEAPGSPATLLVGTTQSASAELFHAMDGALRAAASALARAGLVEGGIRGVA